MTHAMTIAERIAATDLINRAFSEDLGEGEDFTTNSFVPKNAHGAIQIVSRTDGILSGVEIARQCFQVFDENVCFEQLVPDGESLNAGSVIANVSGPMRSLLTVERTALNFLTMLSGIATLTGQFIAAVNGTQAKILDTRKTLPGLRQLQKFAVRCGGGTNHRMGLYDAVLIKDNHLAWLAADGESRLVKAVEEARQYAPDKTTIEIEVDSIDQFYEVLPSSPDIVLLDNMTNQQLSTAVTHRNKHRPTVLLEASGGINIETVSAVAQTGVDRISVGALTHSAVALDIGFDWSGKS